MPLKRLSRELPELVCIQYTGDPVCRSASGRLLGTMLTRIHIPNGVDFAYLDAGSGPAVVLVHGHPLDHTMWQPQIDLRSISSIFS